MCFFMAIADLSNTSKDKIRRNQTPPKHSSGCVPAHPTKSMPTSHSLLFLCPNPFTHFSFAIFFSSTIIENRAFVVLRGILLKGLINCMLVQICLKKKRYSKYAKCVTIFSPATSPYCARTFHTSHLDR